MRASEVRDRVLADHASLRSRIAELEGLARSVREGACAEAAHLRAAGERLLEELARHMEWEDVHLARSSEVAADALELARWLRRDMESEEEEHLRPDLLRDDIVGIDVETG